MLGKWDRLSLEAKVVIWFSAAAFCFAGAAVGEEFTNSIGMKFVRIEAGAFQMGRLGNQVPLEVVPRGHNYLLYGDFDEKPVRQVTITSAFHIGVYEVTNYQYELFDPAHKNLRGKEGLSNGDDEAVINVSWYEAQAFCEWLSEKDGRTYRLPTEAEWEYACRAGTTTAYHAGDVLPEEYHKNPYRSGGPRPVSLRVGETPANAWGLYDMHGNVEEWCQDWYGPYKGIYILDPAGYTTGDFRVTRGGSQGTPIYYLRSANRMGTVPQAKNWITGFRVVMGEMPRTAILLEPKPQRYQLDVVERTRKEIAKGPDRRKPYFKGPRRFVNIPVDMIGPVFASHNHSTALVECANGDLLAAWFSTVSEGNREMVQACSRLRWGADQWEQASLFWDSPDRNDTCPGLWHDGKGKLYHFANSSFSASSRRILSLRTSDDNGASWSTARVILPEFAKGQAPANGPFRMLDGSIALPVDAGGTVVWISSDEGLTWSRTSGRIAGIHAPVAQLRDGRLIAFGRGGNINGQMPMSISYDLGETWQYSATEFPPVGGKQKSVLLRLREGPLFFASFADFGTDIVDASGTKRKVRGLFAALSRDQGKTWINKRLVTDDGPGRAVETTAGGLCLMSSRNAEYRGYMSAVQATNGLIHLITSRQHYAFNLKWLATPQPAPSAPPFGVRAETETFTGPDFDLKDWAHYHSYKGGFNGAGQYTIDALGPLSGLDRVVGKGSFEMTFAIENLRFNRSVRKGGQSFTVLLKDDRVMSAILSMGGEKMGFSLKNKAAGSEPWKWEGKEVRYSALPESVKFKYVYNEAAKQLRVFYGFGGAEANTEMPQSKAGLHFTNPLTESAVIFLLMTDGRADIDSYEIKPIKQ